MSGLCAGNSFPNSHVQNVYCPAHKPYSRGGSSVVVAVTYGV